MGQGQTRPRRAGAGRAARASFVQRPHLLRHGRRARLALILAIGLHLGAGLRLYGRLLAVHVVLDCLVGIPLPVVVVRGARRALFRATVRRRALAGSAPRAAVLLAPETRLRFNGSFPLRPFRWHISRAQVIDARSPVHSGPSGRACKSRAHGLLPGWSGPQCTERQLHHRARAAAQCPRSRGRRRGCAHGTGPAFKVLLHKMAGGANGSQSRGPRA